MYLYKDFLFLFFYSNEGLMSKKGVEIRYISQTKRQFKTNIVLNKNI